MHLFITSNAFPAFDLSNKKSVVQYIKSIQDSLLVPTLKDKEYFNEMLYKNLTFHLISEGVNPLNKQCVKFFRTVMGIDEIVSLCISCNILPGFLSYLSKYKLLDVFLEKYEEIIEKDHLLVDRSIVIFCLLSQLLVQHSSSENLFFKKVIDSIKRINQSISVEKLLKLSDEHVKTLLSCGLSMKNHLTFLTGFQHNISMVVLLRNEISKMVDTEVSITDKVIKLLQQPAGKSLLSSEERALSSKLEIVQLLEHFSTVYDNLSYNLSLTNIIKKYSDLFSAPKISSNSSDIIQKCFETIESNLYGYNEAAITVIEHMIKCSTDLDELDTYVNKIRTNPIALQGSAQIQLLQVLINKLTMKLYHDPELESKDKLEEILTQLKELIVTLAGKLPLKSKIIVFNNQVKLSECFESIDSYNLRNYLEGKFQTKYSLNELNKTLNYFATSLASDKSQLVNLLASISSIAPCDSLNAILSFAITNEIDLVLIAEVLTELPSFFELKFHGGRKVFLEVCFELGLKSLMEDDTEGAVMSRSLARIISLFKNILSYLSNLNLSVCENLAMAIYHDYLKRYLDSKNDQSTFEMLDIACQMFVEIFIEQNVPFTASLPDMFVQLFVIARNLDSNNNKGLLNTKLQKLNCYLMEAITEKAAMETQSEALIMFKWFSRCIFSLDWTTQLIYHDFFQENSFCEHHFILPFCLKQLCRIPETCNANFLDFSKSYPVTSWLRVFIKSPKVLPVNSISENISDINKDSFDAGLQLALLQVLPTASESDWLAVSICLSSLLLYDLLEVKVDFEIFEVTPSVDLSPCLLTLQLVGIFSKCIEKMQAFKSMIKITYQQQLFFMTQWKKLVVETLERFLYNHSSKPSLVLFTYSHIFYTCTYICDYLSNEELKLQVVTLITTLMLNLTNHFLNYKGNKPKKELVIYSKSFSTCFNKLPESERLKQSFDDIIKSGKVAVRS